MVLLFARVVNAAYGVRSEAEISWNQLRKEIETWTETKPWYFDVLWPSEKDDVRDSWPNVVVAEPSHAVGLQYCALCKLLVTAFQPSDVKESIAAGNTDSGRDAIILSHLRQVVGLAVSNPEVSNLVFEACHILAAYGVLLDDQKDRDAALNFLRQVRRTTGWPTAATIARLQSHWEGSTMSSRPFEAA